MFPTEVVKAADHLIGTMVLTRTGKLGKWENIFQSGKSHGILVRLEKFFTQNTGKIRKSGNHAVVYAC